MSNTGTIVQIIGAVVDADFSNAEKLPAIYNALEVTYDLYGSETTLVLATVDENLRSAAATKKSNFQKPIWF